MSPRFYIFPKLVRRTLPPIAAAGALGAAERKGYLNYHSKCEEPSRKWQRSFFSIPFSTAVIPPTDLLQAIIDTNGYNLHLHDKCVLKKDPEFQGAVWADVGGRGVVLFHNSGFSNWYPFIFGENSPGAFDVVHQEDTVRFRHSEALLMAVKECMASKRPLADCLQRHATLGAEESKQAANLPDAYPLWADHTFQVLLGATACLLKFSQNDELRQTLLSTKQCVLVECAPNDGSWGVAMNSSSFLHEKENPEHYTLESKDPSNIYFTAGSWSGSRMRRHTNALGKALMLTRSVLEKVARDPLQASLLQEASLITALEVILEELGNNSRGHGLENLESRAAGLRELFTGVEGARL